MCEDSSLSPATATDETVYSALRQLGSIFDESVVAEQIIVEMQQDFQAAEHLMMDAKTAEGQDLFAPGQKLRAVWLDCISCSVRMQPCFPPLFAENDHFAKTGSGQT